MPLPLPMTVIAGYLGAGKTTLLNAILAGDHGERITVLVNDFGEIAIDESLIANRDGETLALANGCMCCSIGGDLWDAMNRVLAMNPLPDRMVVETSGVADPAKIAQIALADPDLADAGIVTVADTVNLAALLADPMLKDTIERQLRAASLIVQTKVDASDEATVGAITERIAAIAPGRPLVHSSQQDLPVATVLNAPPMTTFMTDARPGPLRLVPGKDHAALYRSWAWTGKATIDEAQLTAFLADDDLGLWRIKGLLRTSDGRWLSAHRAGAFREIEATDAQHGDPRIVAIGLADRMDPAAVEAAWSRVLLG